MIPNHPLSLDDHTQMDTNAIDSVQTRPDKPEEACGVFGVYAPQEDVARLTYFGL